MQSGKKLSFVVETVNNTQTEIEVQDTITGYQLKQYIYDNVTKNLDVLSMKIHYAGVKIEDDRVLSSYKMLQGSKLKLIQSKCDLDQIPGLIVSYEQDQITLQDKTYRMPCGHVIGRDCMTQFIRSLVQQNMYRIICPSYKPNGQRCSCQWDYALCRKIGVFTQEEIVEFQTGLSKNWIMENTIECPRCKQNLYKDGLEINRVRCPRCKYGDFCISCCKIWVGPDNFVCGNKGCNILDQVLEKSPWDKPFKLRDVNKTQNTYMAPKHRACPKCHSLIEHSSGCKHMACSVCKTSFCWVCLGIQQKGSWKCGGPFDYCGKIAQTQKLSESS